MTTVDLPIGPEESVAGLLQALNDSDWRIRRNAVALLSYSGDKNAVQAILEAMRDDHENLNLVTSALQILSGAGVDTFAALVDFLNDPHPDLRCCAALTLGLQNNSRGIPPLRAALNDDDTTVRFHAIEALGRLRSAEASEALIAIAETRNFTLSFAAVEALASIGDERVAFRLVPLLDDDLLQIAVIDALGHVGAEEAVQPLLALLNNNGAPVDAIAQSLVRLNDRAQCAGRHGAFIVQVVRHIITPNGVRNLLDALKQANNGSIAAVVTVLTWLENPDVDTILAKRICQPEVLDSFVVKGALVVDILIEQLTTGALETRQAAVIALGRIGSAAAVPPLLRVLTENAELTVVAAGALATIGDRRAYAPLLDLLDWADPAIRRAAVSALNSLGHIDMAIDMKYRLSDPRPRVRECAVRIVGYAGYPELIDLLVECCQDEHEGVRRVAVESLPCVEEDRRIQSALALALTDHFESVRAAAARTLGQCPPAIAGALLQKALADRSVWVRYYAARSLARLQYAPALDDLLRLAQWDEAIQVRVAAVEAIGKFGVTAVVPVLTTIAQSSESDLARASLAALGAGGQNAAIPVLAAALSSGDAARRVEAIRALGESRCKDAVPFLTQAARSTENDVAVTGINALQRLAVGEAVDALLVLAETPTLRDACETALAKCDVAQVALGLNNSMLDVRLAVIRALARAKDSRALSLLCKGIDDREGAIRFAALRSLAYSENPPAKQTLTALASTDTDFAVRRAAQALLLR